MALSPTLTVLRLKAKVEQKDPGIIVRRTQHLGSGYSNRRHTRGEPADLPEGAGAGTPRTRAAGRTTAPRCGNRDRVSCTDPPGRTVRSRSRRARSPRDLVPPVRTSPRPRRFSSPSVEPGRPPRRTPSQGTAPRDGNRCGEASADPRSLHAVRSAPAPREPPRDPTVAGPSRGLPDRHTREAEPALPSGPQVRSATFGPSRLARSLPPLMGVRRTV